MIRRVSVLAVVMVLASIALSCVSRNNAPPPTTPVAHAIEEATHLNALMEKLFGEGKYQEAMASAERSLALREQALSPQHPAVAESLANLGALHCAQGAYAKAEPLFLRALDIDEKALGATHPEVARILSNLASLYTEQGAYSKAE